MYLQMRPQAQGQSRTKAPVQIVDPATLFGGEILFVADLHHRRLEDRGGFYAASPLMRLGRRWSHVGLWTAAPGRMFSISETSSQMSFWLDDGVWTFGPGGKPIRIAAAKLSGWMVVSIDRVSDTRIQARINGIGAITGEPFDIGEHRENVILFSARGVARQSPYEGQFGGGVWIDRVLTNKERLGIEAFYQQQLEAALHGGGS